jgi:hypothetical protein
MRRSPRFDPAESDREFGSHAEFFGDRFVCVVDASNPRLRDGRLTLDDLSALPHAAPTSAPGSRSPSTACSPGSGSPSGCG